MLVYLYRMKYTKELLEAAVKDCISIAGVLRKLGLVQAGGTHTHISKKIREFNLDISHFRGQGANHGPYHKGSKKLSWGEVLVVRESGMRQKTFRLRRALIESGKEYRCEGNECQVTSEWRDKPITLEVNHKNGNWLDDRSENLEFLCPNCHSQTDNYCGKKGIVDLTSVSRQGRDYRMRKRAKIR